MRSSPGRDSNPQPPDCKSGTLPHIHLRAKAADTVKLLLLNRHRIKPYPKTQNFCPPPRLCPYGQSRGRPYKELPLTVFVTLQNLFALCHTNTILTYCWYPKIWHRPLELRSVTGPPETRCPATWFTVTNLVVLRQTVSVLLGSQ